MAYYNEQASDRDIYKFLLDDVQCKYTKNTHEGYSVMLFGT